MTKTLKFIAWAFAAATVAALLAGVSYPLFLIALTDQLS